ncbi:heme ABC transporter ATP-binding protein [Budviciaceae bacterium BWR-B9]|uniref:Heme ABC transporter ATP-binding protein n=1 Tax=Limnobaculum allomyrinae TaxID=2791986 RepID=A0ABS1ISC5_9GAMM|nr:MULTISPECIES: heme ABC transporter ATP-binding protein [Limnobaculum]MBK5144544.1 heme ABC transporter ATP-binding protein [Limnobaculum allomyrinae]MBV7692227.1 heme ABC transporter ATP-binding protein [Limnobaculum sp. M2-1]
MIEAQNLVYSVHHRKLTDNVSLTLPGGEIVAILGPNGAGKSTLLRQLTGYLQPTSGQCLLFGKPLNQWSVKELAKARAVMRQNSGMAFPFSVKEVIEMGFHTRKDPARDDSLAQIMALCSCENLAKRNYCHLSGGEQQRVHLARLLAQLWQNRDKPKWLFLDEPTSALDVHYQQQLFRLLKKLVKEDNFNVCCVLHDLNLASLYADRMILLDQGRIIANGTPDEVLNESMLSELYHADLRVSTHPEACAPLVFLRS